jgi:hypothetical protein
MPGTEPVRERCAAVPATTPIVGAAVGPEVFSSRRGLAFRRPVRALALHRTPELCQRAAPAMNVATM